MRRTLVAVVAGALSVPAAAQTKPDFSGEWIMNRQASTLSPAASSIQSGHVSIEHREPAFRYKASLRAGTAPIDYEFQVTTDGRDVTGTQQGRPVVTRLTWDGDQLLLTSRIARADDDLRITFRYELLENGRRLRATEQLRGGGRDQDNVWVFDRQSTTTITRLYTGADGQSHAEDAAVAWRPAQLRAELSESEAVRVTGAQFLRWPRGFVWEGHPASKRQYVIVVSGRGEVDVADGMKVQLTPGRVLMAEDVTGKGHITRVGPDEDLVMLLVPLATN
jgi:quercetin dioxygenase-like cupin family protein